MRNELTRERLKGMLSAEQCGLSKETKEAAKRDFLHVANEYFETDGKIKLEIAESPKNTVTVTFTALRAKNFTTLK